MNSSNNSWQKWLSDPSVQRFIDENEKGDIADLAFKLSSFPINKRSFILDQINGRNKAKKKLPHLSRVSKIVYPSNISMEQSSSSATGQYKAKMLNGNRIVDLTAGFGVDAYYFSKVFTEIDLVEPSKALLDITAHNFKSLGITNARFQHNDARTFLDLLKTKVDAIFLDPSRRNSGERLLDVRDYHPNIIDILDLIEEKANQILIKLSPVTDIRQIIRMVPNLSTITVLSVKNECKEILVLISKGKKYTGEINCVDLINKNQRSYSFNLKFEEEGAFRFEKLKKYAYLPMTAVVKAGAYKSVSRDYGLGKISANTHIYTSNDRLVKFPGRTFKCLSVLPFNKKSLKNEFIGDNYNVLCRNFPLKPNEVAKKLGIHDSGDLYIIAFRDEAEKNQLIVAELLSLNV